LPELFALAGQLGKLTHRCEVAGFV